MESSPGKTHKIIYTGIQRSGDQCSLQIQAQPLRCRIPLTDWTRISPITIQLATSGLRRKLNKSLLLGNFGPFYPPELQITNPNMKGCKQFFNTLSSHSFDTSCWAKFTQFTTDYALPPEKQIIKLSNTLRAIEAKD